MKEYKHVGTREEADLIHDIVLRAEALLGSAGPLLGSAGLLLAGYKRMNLHMDIAGCHLNGCPLKLRELLDADDFNFAHDVWGISRHINRETAQLENCFLPRYAA